MFANLPRMSKERLVDLQELSVIICKFIFERSDELSDNGLYKVESKRV